MHHERVAGVTRDARARVFSLIADRVVGGGELQVTLVPTEMIELKGVRMIRYLVDNSTWAVNETLYNSIPVRLRVPSRSPW
jgi:hypothetical protein